MSARSYSSGVPATGGRMPGARLGEAIDDDFLEGSEAYAENLVNMLTAPDIDGHEIRHIVTELSGMDYIPESSVIQALMIACRTVNDYALAIRILETVKYKCGTDTSTYNKLMEPVQPTLKELGILTPEEMGYDKPEFYWPHPSDIHNYDSATGKPI